jgi:hypothetical protein
VKEKPNNARAGKTRSRPLYFFFFLSFFFAHHFSAKFPHSQFSNDFRNLFKASLAQFSHATMVHHFYLSSLAFGFFCGFQPA